MPGTKLPSKLESSLYKEFEFTTEHNHESGLLQQWNEGRIFINPTPPFRQGSTELYIHKALRCKADTVVLLVPCDTSTDWFNDIWEAHKADPDRIELRFFRGRIKYESTYRNENDIAPSRFAHRIPSCLVVIRNGKPDLKD